MACVLPTWGNFQSIIQLGIGLHFAYASLEAISDKPLVLLSERHSVALAAIKNAVATRKLPNVKPGDFQKVAKPVEKLNRLSTNLKAANPYLATLFGLVGIGFLVYASFRNDDRMSVLSVGLTLFISLAWFVISLSTELFLRRQIDKTIQVYPSFGN